MLFRVLLVLYALCHKVVQFHKRQLSQVRPGNGSLLDPVRARSTDALDKCLQAEG